MIVFDLKCAQAHVFEAWFGSSADYEEQKAKGLLSCPLCGDAQVSKALMAPNVAPKGNRKSAAPVPLAQVPSDEAPAPGQVKAFLRHMAEMQRHVEENFENVGDRFPEEARAIHYGEKEERPLYGEATLEEARELLEEGVAIAPLPFQRRRKRLNA